MSVAVAALIRLISHESASTAPSCAMIKPQNNGGLPKIVCTSCGLPETSQATTPVRQSPPVIQPYTRLMNRAFSAEMEAISKAGLPRDRLPNDWLGKGDCSTPQL